MKTTTKTHATNATHVTNEGETNMKTTATESASPIITNPATPSATPVTMSPRAAGTLAYIQHCTSLLDQLEAAFPQVRDAIQHWERDLTEEQEPPACSSSAGLEGGAVDAAFLGIIGGASPSS